MSFTDVGGDGPINPSFKPATAQLGAGSSQRSSSILIEPDDDLIATATHGSDRVSTDFKTSERKWKHDTRYVSSLSEKYLHESYAHIISLGWQVVPLILRSMQHEPDDWFYALRAITAADPVRPAHAGIMPKMTEAWIRWGRQRRLI